MKERRGILIQKIGVSCGVFLTVCLPDSNDLIREGIGCKKNYLLQS